MRNKKKNYKDERCITCASRVNRNKAHIVIEFKGEYYLACCPLCQSEFEKNPEEYIKK